MLLPGDVTSLRLLFAFLKVGVTQPNTSGPDFARIATVWRTFHILSPVQAFIVCVVSAVLVATGFAIVAILHGRTGLFRDFFWPHQVDPFVIFGAVFLALLIVLLAYYHLGSLGILLMLPASIGTYYGIALCAIYLFMAGVSLGVIGYLIVLCLCTVFLYLAHNIANASRKIEEAQRRFRLRGCA